jgi:hypothetical protein
MTRRTYRPTARPPATGYRPPATGHGPRARITPGQRSIRTNAAFVIGASSSAIRRARRRFSLSSMCIGVRLRHIAELGAERHGRRAVVRISRLSALSAVVGRSAPIAALLGAVGILLTGCTGHHKARPAPGGASFSTTSPVVIRSDTPQEQANISAAAALLAALPRQLAGGDMSGLLPGGLAQTATQARTTLPAGASITVDPHSWRRTGAVSSISVTVHFKTGANQHYVALLIKSQSGWNLSETYRSGAQ